MDPPVNYCSGSKNAISLNTCIGRAKGFFNIKIRQKISMAVDVFNFLQYKLPFIFRLFVLYIYYFFYYFFFGTFLLLFHGILSARVPQNYDARGPDKLTVPSRRRLSLFVKAVNSPNRSCGAI